MKQLFEQLEYANMVISDLEHNNSILQAKLFDEFCRNSNTEESMSVSEYSPKYFNEIFKNYKSQAEISALSTRELQSIYFDCGFGDMSKFRDELSMIQRSKAVTLSDNTIRSLDILCRKKLVLRNYFLRDCDDEISERVSRTI